MSASAVHHTCTTILGLLLVSLLPLPLQAARPETIAIGAAAPNFSLPGADNKT